MRTKNLALIPGLLLLLLATAALADDAPARDAAPATETAVFAVPDLADAGLVKNLTKALAKHEGVVAAKADAEAGKFLVTFEPGRTNPEALTKVVAKVAPKAQFETVQAADGKAAGADPCGKCPSKAGCAGKK
ncbi:MAG: heavy-metal-associated domain-containing protein [Candidatus Krumholzibacteriia bacterium]